MKFNELQDLITEGAFLKSLMATSLIASPLNSAPFQSKDLSGPNLRGVSLGNYSNDEDDEDFDELVARVIFAETGPKSIPAERLLIASVIKNRINHYGFKRAQHKTMGHVVKEKGQFSSINDNKNINWKKSDSPWTMNSKELAVWNQAVLLAQGKFTSYNKDIVYFHDKSIEKPKNWDNKYWKTELVFNTKHFLFYKVTPK